MNIINRTFYYFRKSGIPIIIVSLLLNVYCFELSAQEPPPKPVVVTVTKDLGFGAFTQGSSGGSVIINSGGFRSSTGDVILLNLGYFYSAAIYKLVGTPGTVISILNGPDVHLNGSGGGFLVLHIGDSNPASPFVITSSPASMSVGGTLTVTAANLPGNYIGTFEITFIQE